MGNVRVSGCYMGYRVSSWYNQYAEAVLCSAFPVCKKAGPCQHVFSLDAGFPHGALFVLIQGFSQFSMFEQRAWGRVSFRFFSLWGGGGVVLGVGFYFL